MTENITGSCVCSMHREFNLHHNVQLYRFLTTRPHNLFTFHILYFFSFSCFCLMQLFFLTKNDKKSTRGIQSIFWRQMEWVSLASLFIPSCVACVQTSPISFVRKQETSARRQFLWRISIPTKKNSHLKDSYFFLPKRCSQKTVKPRPLEILVGGKI